MAETIQIPNNIPVSWLSRQTSADSDTLFLVSVPDERTETQFMSKYLKYGDFCSELSSAFQVGWMKQWIDTLCSEYAPILENAADNTLCCATTPDPYIISSITQSSFNIVSLSGYRLSSGMDTVFKNVVFEQISATNIYSDDITTISVVTRSELSRISANPDPHTMYFCTDR